MNYLVQKTFEHRGISWQDYVAYERSDHGLLKDIDALCNELHKIHVARIHLIVYPDFDMDGICSGTIGFAGLSELGFYVSLYIPNPKAGYGLHKDDVDAILAQYPDAGAILTCDVGIGCQDAIDYANSLGLITLVTDHHIQKHPINAKVVVDPLRLDETYAHPSICGAYVLFQVLERYTKLYCSDTYLPVQISRLAVFAGIGTISDSMTLLYENRKLVRDAISILKLCWDTNMLSYMQGCPVYLSVFYGLHEVLQIFKNMEKLTCVEDIDEMFFGFYLAPMFNSVKRTDGDISRAFSVFFGNQKYEDVEYLYDLNQKRKEMTVTFMEQISQRDQSFAPFIYFSDAPDGILGLLAQQIMNMTGLPVCVVREEPDGFCHGSGRSPMWYPFLKQTAGVIQADGHNPAFGVKFPTPANVLTGYAFLEEDVKSVYQMLPEESLQPVYDFVISTDGTGDIGIDIMEFLLYLDEIQNYKPFGRGFESPNILFQFDSSFVQSCSVMGGTKQHLKLTFFNAFSVILWNQADKKDALMKAGTHQVSGHLQTSEFRGNLSVDFIGNYIS